MDGNYEWQKFQANERVQARLQEAETHRQVRVCGNGRAPFASPIRFILKVFRSVLIRFLHGDVSRTISAQDDRKRRERLV